MAFRLLAVAALTSAGALRQEKEWASAQKSQDDLMDWLLSRCPALQDGFKKDESRVYMNLGRLFAALAELSETGLPEQEALKQFTLREQEVADMQKSNPRMLELLKKGGNAASGIADSAWQNAGSAWRSWMKNRTKNRNTNFPLEAEEAVEMHAVEMGAVAEESGALLEVNAGERQWEHLYQYYWTNAVSMLIPLRIRVWPGQSPDGNAPKRTNTTIDALGTHFLEIIDALNAHLQRSEQEDGQPEYFPQWVGTTRLKLMQLCMEKHGGFGPEEAATCQPEFDLKDPSSIWARVNTLASAVQVLGEDLVKDGVTRENCAR